MAFIRKLLYTLQDSIKNLEPPESLHEMAQREEKSFKFENDEEPGFTDANIIIDAIRTKCDSDKLFFTLQKDVEATDS